MRAQIKGFDCGDVPDLETWKPLNPTDVYFGLTIHIGPEDEKVADLFQLGVATREGLQRVLGENYRNPGRHMRVINRREWQLIDEGKLSLWGLVEEHIQTIVGGCEGDDWHEIATKLSEYFAWEFENYKG